MFPATPRDCPQDTSGRVFYTDFKDPFANIDVPKGQKPKPV